MKQHSKKIEPSKFADMYLADQIRELRLIEQNDEVYLAVVAGLESRTSIAFLTKTWRNSGAALRWLRSNGICRVVMFLDCGDDVVEEIPAEFFDRAYFEKASRRHYSKLAARRRETCRHRTR